MAKLFESHVKRDPNFEVPAERHLGLVVFSLKVCDVDSTWGRGGLSGLSCYLSLKKQMNTLVRKPHSHCGQSSLRWMMIIYRGLHWGEWTFLSHLVQRLIALLVLFHCNSLNKSNPVSRVDLVIKPGRKSNWVRHHILCAKLHLGLNSSADGFLLLSNHVSTSLSICWL